MAIPSMVRRIEPIVDRRRFRHDPPEGVRRHAKASRHADAFDPRQPAQVRALAANDRDLHLVNLLKTQHVLLDHCDTSEAAVLRCTALADRITGASSSVEPRVGHVLIDNTRTSCPHFRRLWPRPTILRHDPGLAASPPVRYTLRVARREISLPLPFAVRWN
jgi:hypothetical protein